MTTHGSHAKLQLSCQRISQSFKNSRCMSNNRDRRQPLRTLSTKISSCELMIQKNGYKFRNKVRRGYHTCRYELSSLFPCLLSTPEIGCPCHETPCTNIQRNTNGTQYVRSSFLSQMLKYFRDPEYIALAVACIKQYLTLSRHFPLSRFFLIVKITYQRCNVPVCRSEMSVQSQYGKVHNIHLPLFPRILFSFRNKIIILII